jgi:ubiquinone/menaquinone biosynthesis C-methylase UbiE
MTDEHTRKIQTQFTRQARAYADTDQARDLKAMASLVRLTEAGNQSKTLDVACGPGRLTMAFAQVADTAVGFDATDALLEIARTEAAALGLDNLTFEQGDARDLPFDSESFDIVSCRAAFHHFAEPDRVLSEMARVTHAGGTLLIADILGNANPEIGARHDQVEQFCDPTHVRCIPGSEFESLFAANGLDIGKALTNTMSYEVEGWIAHGGPGRDMAERIRTTFEADLNTQELGLNVRLENDVLTFSHNTVLYLLRKN